MFKSLVYQTSLFLLLLALVTGCKQNKNHSGGDTSTPANTTKSPSDTTDKSQKNQPIINSQRDVDEAINKLLPGQAFHQVPSKMKVGMTYQILVGIAAKRITKDEVIRELRGKNNDLNIKFIPDISYDPINVEVQLIADPDEFKVRDVTPKNQAISSKRPTIWQWDVKPLKFGKHKVTLLATVNLHISNIKEPKPITFVVFDETIPVEVNYQYSTTEFLEKNWKEVIGLIFGSGSLAGAMGWYFGKRHEKSKEPSKDFNNNK